MSSLAPSLVLVLLKGKLSPVNGWRVGFTQTFGHTSVTSSAVMSLIALCQWKAWHPRGAERMADTKWLATWAMCD